MGSVPFRMFPARGRAARPTNFFFKAKEQMKEYDFSKGERGKFYNPNAVFSFPVYLDPDINDFMNKLADKKDVDVQELVNEWLRVDIKLVQSAQQTA